MQINSDKNKDGRKGVKSHNIAKADRNNSISIRPFPCLLLMLCVMSTPF